MRNSPFQNPYIMGLATLAMGALTVSDFMQGRVNAVTLLTFAAFFLCFGETLMALRKK